MSACVDGGAQWEASEGEAEQRRGIVFHRCRRRVVSTSGAVTVVLNATVADIGGGTIVIVSVVAIVVLLLALLLLSVPLPLPLSLVLLSVPLLLVLLLLIVLLTSFLILLLLLCVSCCEA